MCERRGNLLQVTTPSGTRLGLFAFSTRSRGGRRGRNGETRGGSPDLVKRGGSARRSYTKQGQQEVVPVSQVLSAVPPQDQVPHPVQDQQEVVSVFDIVPSPKPPSEL